MAPRRAGAPTWMTRGAATGGGRAATASPARFVSRFVSRGASSAPGRYARSRDSGRRTRLRPAFKLRETRGSKMDGALRFVGVGARRRRVGASARVQGRVFVPM